MSSNTRSITPGDIEALLRQAVLAPSSHNTQPWRFDVSENRIRLFADPTRALPVNDPYDRELAISCGCALFNLRSAAAAAGLHASVAPLPEPQDEELLAVVDLEALDQAVDADLAALAAAIPERRTYRKRFADRPVPQDALEALRDAAAREGAWLEVLDDSGREAAVKLVGEGDKQQWANPSWRRELAAWMHPSRRGDGLTFPGLLVPLAQAVVRSFDIGDGVAARDSQLAEGSPVLAVLGTELDAPRHWLDAGQALERLLLTACDRGLQASYLNQPIQVAALRPRLRELLASPGLPQLLLRLGFATEEIEATPRRELVEVLAADGP
jgi:nitroreductase